MANILMAIACQYVWPIHVNIYTCSQYMYGQSMSAASTSEIYGRLYPACSFPKPPPSSPFTFTMEPPKLQHQPQNYYSMKSTLLEMIRFLANPFLESKDKF